MTIIVVTATVNATRNITSFGDEPRFSVDNMTRVMMMKKMMITIMMMTTMMMMCEVEMAMSLWW